MTPFRLNIYAGRCAGCGNTVAPKAGSLVGQRSDGSWDVRHNRCVPQELWVAKADDAWATFNDPQQ